MNAEIIAIGTEILLGQITNTNAQYLSQELANLGINVYFQTVVGDNEQRLRQALELAGQRADLVICTGGLGPTQDDITKQVLASFAHKGLTMHEPTLEQINQFFEARGRVMSDDDARQAILIEGSDALVNDVGMAVGLALQHQDTSFMLIPGPPREMKAMFENHVKKWLRDKLALEDPLYSKTMKFVGIGESSLERQLIDLINTQQDPTIAPYAKEGEVALRLSTKAPSYELAEKKLAATVATIYERLSDHIYAEEDISIEQAIIQLMTDRGLTLSVAESCTGGMLSHLLTAIPGSSKVFKGGVICYSNEVKTTMLNVPTTMLEGPDAPGAISSETTSYLAEQLADETSTDYAIAITGVSGPNSAENKPIGLVYIALKEKGKSPVVSQSEQTGNRDIVNLKACKIALYELWMRVKHA